MPTVHFVLSQMARTILLDAWYATIIHPDTAGSVLQWDHLLKKVLANLM